MSDLPSPAASDRPFAAAPNASRYFPSAVAEESRQRISRAIARSEGPALLIGAAGMGKSLLLEVLAEQFSDLREVVPLTGGQICTRRGLLQTVLFQLDLPYRDMDEGELRLAILDHLEPGDEPSRRLLLLVDEADSLPVRLLEELRVLTNVARGGEPLVSLVLAGGPVLEEQFADPQLTGFSQRLSARCYLAAMGREETFQYVRAQVAATGVNPDELFAQDALESIFAATDGVPRLINQLGDQLVWSAHETGKTPFNGQTVQQAWSQLQQLPAPWDTPPASNVVEESDVEFGELCGEEEFLGEQAEDDLPASIPISFQPRDDAEVTATFDVTEQLLGHIEELDLTGEITTAKPAAEQTAPMAYNPFAESFGSEEIVLDQYLAFECELLASAPRVINRLDTAFAAQLQDVAVERDLISMTSTTEDAPIIAASTAVENIEFDTELDPEEKLDVLLVADSPHEDVPGELLVIEDEGRPQVQLVEGRQFRQLFSTLQAQSRIG
jgi:type II secretory pathway predicted ATPase ExeA